MGCIMPHLVGWVTLHPREERLASTDMRNAGRRGWWLWGMLARTCGGCKHFSTKAVLSGRWPLLQWMTKGSATATALSHSPVLPTTRCVAECPLATVLAGHR